MALTRKAKTQTPAQELLAIARVEAKKSKTWIELSNALYGLGGPFGRLFPEPTSRTAFAKSPEYKEVSTLIDSLSGPEDDRAGPVASGKLLLRLPVSLHAALTREAEQEGVSVNQLCIAKLAAQLAAIVRPM